MTLRSPAKINLSLRVGPLREDGYHEIDTLFQAVSLFDELTIEPSGGQGLEEDNLVMRALRLLDPVRAWSARLEKRIPIQAGLGGGSSDAAAALMAGARLLGREERDLPALAAQLGSDVAFFLVGGRARGRGRGERLEPLPDLPARWFCLAKPDIGVPTPEAFRLLDSTVRCPAEGDFPNDFQAPIFMAFPPIAATAARMVAAGAGEAFLCGSGAAVAGTFPSEKDARIAAELLTSVGLWSQAARTLRRDEWPP